MGLDIYWPACESFSHQRSYRRTVVKEAVLTHWILGDVAVILISVIFECMFNDYVHGHALILILLSDECHRRTVMVSEHWSCNDLVVFQHWPFVRRIHQSQVDYSHKGPVMHKAFPCHDVIMTASGHSLHDCSASDITFLLGFLVKVPVYHPALLRFLLFKVISQAEQQSQNISLVV